MASERGRVLVTLDKDTVSWPSCAEVHTAESCGS